MKSIAYIAENLLAPAAAQDLRECLEDAILSLEIFPERGPFAASDAMHIGLPAATGKTLCFDLSNTTRRKRGYIVTVRYTTSQF